MVADTSSSYASLRAPSPSHRSLSTSSASSTSSSSSGHSYPSSRQTVMFGAAWSTGPNMPQSQGVADRHSTVTGKPTGGERSQEIEKMRRLSEAIKATLEESRRKQDAKKSGRSSSETSSPTLFDGRDDGDGRYPDFSSRWSMRANRDD